jgi:hypothetical protein
MGVALDVCDSFGKPTVSRFDGKGNTGNDEYGGSSLKEYETTVR